MFPGRHRPNYELGWRTVIWVEQSGPGNRFLLPRCYSVEIRQHIRTYISTLYRARDYLGVAYENQSWDSMECQAAVLQGHSCHLGLLEPEGLDHGLRGSDAKFVGKGKNCTWEHTSTTHCDQCIEARVVPVVDELPPHQLPECLLAHNCVIDIQAAQKITLVATYPQPPTRGINMGLVQGSKKDLREQ